MIKSLSLIVVIVFFTSIAFGQVRQTVKAVAGDTVEKLAKRNGADPAEVAKKNGLLPNSLLPAGREILISGEWDDERCNLLLKDAPTVRGLKLGMSRESASKILGPIKSGFFFADTTQLARVPGFDHIRSLTLLFTADDRLFTAEINYDFSVRWTSAEEFVVNAAGKLSLPTDGWTYESSAKLQCEEFTVELLPYMNVLRMQDDVELRKLENHKKESEAKKKSEFKP